MSDQKTYGYVLRPAYGSDELLLEFDYCAEKSWELVLTLKALLENNGFYVTGEAPGLLDEAGFIFSSANGEVVLSMDTAWDLIFISGDNNREDILRIDQFLTDSGFMKGEADFSKYK